jgi:hypothetical protein
MKAEENPLAAIRKSIAAAQRQFEGACAKADRILEAQQNEIAQYVQSSAGKVASLESDLELYDALEQSRRAASTRTEIAAAMNVHHCAVDGAKARLRHAWEDYYVRISAACAALAACQFEAAV